MGHICLGSASYDVKKKTEINDSRVDGGFQFACCLFSIDGAMYDSAAAAPAEISNVLSMQQKKKKNEE